MSGFHFAAEKFPERGDVALVVTRRIDRRFENEGAAGEQRVIQNAAKRFEADFPFSDVVVAVDARAVMRFRIIGVDDVNALEADGEFDVLERGFETFLGANVPARGESVRGVDADAGGDVAQQIANCARSSSNFAPMELPWPAVFSKKDHEIAELESARRPGECPARWKRSAASGVVSSALATRGWITRKSAPSAMARTSSP